METKNAYWAGFFDGEGCITINKAEVKGRQDPRYTLHITVSNKFKLTLEEIQKEFGGSIADNKGCWILRMESNIAEKFLKAIYPYLQVKKEQAEIAFEFQKHRYQGQRRSFLRNLKFEEAYKKLKELKL